MSDKKELQGCFETLNKHLFQIRTNPLISTFAVKEHAISDIIHGGIFRFDPEDSLQFILTYINQVDELLGSIEDIITKLEIKENTINPFEENLGPKLNGKHELKVEKEEELNYYKSELEKINIQIENQIDNLGSDRFANAGFKLKFDLTGEEIAALFTAFLEERILQRKTSVGQDLTKQRLAEFISRNFSSKESATLSQSYIANLLNESNPSSAKTAQKLRSVIKYLNN